MKGNKIDIGLTTQRHSSLSLSIVKCPESGVQWIQPRNVSFQHKKGEFAFGYLPLETIVLTQNSLTSLPVLFEDPGNNLKKLVLSNNNLTSIDARNLDGLG